MRTVELFLGIFLVAIAVGATPGKAQVASPPARTACKFADGKTITVNYSSPRMRGRKIFGGLVPFGEVWRDLKICIGTTWPNTSGKVQSIAQFAALNHEEVPCAQ